MSIEAELVELQAIEIGSPWLVIPGFDSRWKLPPGHRPDNDDFCAATTAHRTPCRISDTHTGKNSRTKMATGWPSASITRWDHVPDGHVPDGHGHGDGYNLGTATATKATYNGSIDLGLIDALHFYLDEFGQVAPLFGLRDLQTETDLLFDLSDPMQLGIVYPDNTAVIFNDTGITVLTADGSSVVALVLPVIYDYLVQQGGGGGGTRKSKRRTFQRPQQVKVVVFDQCGHTPTDPFDVELSVGPGFNSGFDCIPHGDVVNGIPMQGVNGLYKWECTWPNPDSPEQECEVALLRQLGYYRDSYGTAVPATDLVSIFSRGLGLIPPPNGAAASILNNTWWHFVPLWSPTILGLNGLIYLEQLIESQGLDPNATAQNICIAYSNLNDNASPLAIIQQHNHHFKLDISDHLTLLLPHRILTTANIRVLDLHHPGPLRRSAGISVLHLLDARQLARRL
ncbi:hypothetical protein B0T26DRAFT_877200 [Lasiosphaeria miniovina]|uniref:Uncharacterized protein n=1 Tax=Lasiosphaeria miniovina TaxID=1954250 RepID=A0AA39ZQS4_9PEZI|nr:uncharacterized protein B0T26DRAFT_877200 [Lasiosphaeria miniovina]KAK0701942.1 hypothetical protein B0T26DRAFT_877200 [Lasiosphaeria miniovina]